VQCLVDQKLTTHIELRHALDNLDIPQEIFDAFNKALSSTPEIRAFSRDRNAPYFSATELSPNIGLRTSGNRPQGTKLPSSMLRYSLR
jgi:hypothetical protein